MTTIKSFVNRLAKIGIKVELIANYPWIYLDKVNGKNVWGLFHANHGFTAFFSPVRRDQKEHISDIPVVFAKIREMLSERIPDYEVYYLEEQEEDDVFKEIQVFYGSEAQCKSWVNDYDRYDDYLIRKLQ